MGPPECRSEVGEEGLQGSLSRDSCQGQEVCVLETLSCGHLMTVEGDPGPGGGAGPSEEPEEPELGREGGARTVESEQSEREGLGEIREETQAPSGGPASLPGSAFGTGH